MAKANYDYCLKQILKHEGGYSNHPMDKGGPTKYGITIANYQKYVKPKATAQDVKNMTLDEAKKVYKARYWDYINADDLPSGIDLCLFDYCVNSGVGRLGTVHKKLGKDYSDPVKYINKVCDERLAFMKAIRGGKDWQYFGKGWSRRVADVRKNSVALAKGSLSTKQESTAVALPLVATAGAATQVPETFWTWTNISLVAVGVVLGIAAIRWFIKRSNNVK